MSKEEMSAAKYQALAMRTAKQMEPKMAMIHAALGLASDAGEYIEAANTEKPSIPHIVEELGDCMWFLSYACDVHGINLEDIIKEGPIFGLESFETELVASVGHYCTVIKAYCIYGKPLDQVEVVEHLRDIYFALSRCADTWSLHLPTVCSENIAKLQKRYPDKYTDEAAIARADKVDGAT